MENQFGGNSGIGATLSGYLFRFARVLPVVAMFGASIFAQSAPSTSLSKVVPESAFVSPKKYTNAFFGFSFPLPQGAPLRELSIPSKTASSHYLFGVKALTRGLTAMTVMANESEVASAHDACKVASGQKGQAAKKAEIGGRDFWKSESQENAAGGKLRNICFATELDGYVLQFNIMSFDAKVADELRKSVEAITFFDPAKAEEVAGPGSHAYNPAANSPKTQ